MSGASSVPATYVEHYTEGAFAPYVVERHPVCAGGVWILEKAKALLATTDAPVTEVALDVGYESSRALARAFLREVGTTPTAWRRDHHV